MLDMELTIRVHLKNIKEYLYNLKANGFMELAKVAQFSNGEAFYKEVA